VLLLLLAALTVVVLTTQSAEKDGLGMVPLRTSYSSRPTGTKALYVSLEELGLPVARRHASFARLPDSAGLLLIVSPLRPISAREWKQLKAWTARGHYVCLALEDAMIPDWLQPVMLEEGADETFEINSSRPLGDSPFSAGVTEIHFRGATRLARDQVVVAPVPAEAADPEASPGEAAEEELEKCEPGGT